MWVHCKRSCERCLEAEECKDHDEGCKQLRIQGSCESHPEETQAKCPKSCALCLPAKRSLAGATAAAAAKPKAAKPETTLFRGFELKSPCKHVVIDIGSGGGSALDKFMSPSSYIGNMAAATGTTSPWAKETDTITQQMEAADRKQWCIFAFEGNKFFKKQLEHLQKTYSDVAQEFKVFVPAIISAQDGGDDLFLDLFNSDGSSPWWGTSLFNNYLQKYLASPDGAATREDMSPDEIAEASKQVGARVASARLDTLLKQYIEQGSNIILRMDISGGEYKIIEDAIIKSGLLCDFAKEHFRGKARVHLFIKWHRFMEQAASVQPRWTEELERKMIGCGIQMHSYPGATA